VILLPSREEFVEMNTMTELADYFKRRKEGTGRRLEPQSSGSQSSLLFRFRSLLLARHNALLQVEDLEYGASREDFVLNLVFLLYDFGG